MEVMATGVDTPRQGIEAIRHQHGRSSMPSVMDGSVTARPQLYGNSNNNNTRPLLPRLSTGSLLSDSEEKKPKLLLETVIIPARAVALSMMTVSNSCPDLTNRKRNGSPPIASSNSDVTATSHQSRPVRCRVPLSMASTPRLTRKSSGYLQTARESLTDSCLNGRVIQSEATQTPEGTPNGTQTPEVTPKGTQTPEGTPKLRRRPATQEGRLSCSSASSPVTTPKVNRRRRAGQYSLTAVNDVLAQPSVTSAWTASGAEPQPSARTCGVSRYRDSLSGNPKDTSSNVPQTPPLTSRQQSGQQLTRQSGNPKQPIVKRVSSLSLPSNRSASGSKDVIGGACRVDGSQVKSAPSEVVENSLTGEVQEEQSGTEGMAPETYQRCRQWVIDVESAKGDRPLDAIMLPPVQLIE